MRRAIALKPVEIKPPKMVSAKGYSFRNGCPLCGYKSMIGIYNETLTKQVAGYCGSCDIQFNDI